MTERIPDDEPLADVIWLHADAMHDDLAGAELELDDEEPSPMTNAVDVFVLADYIAMTAATVIDNPASVSAALVEALGDVVDLLADARDRLQLAA